MDQDEPETYSINGPLPKRVGDLKIIGKIQQVGHDPTVTVKCMRRGCGRVFRRRLYRLKTAQRCCARCAAADLKAARELAAVPLEREGPPRCQVCYGIPDRAAYPACPECGLEYQAEEGPTTRFIPAPPKPVIPPVVADVLIQSIRVDGGTQSRVGLIEATVEEYAEKYRQGCKFPPPVVYFDRRHHWLGDGFHRVEAAKRAGFERIDCEVKLGTKRDAILFSVGANALHGLRRTTADKRNACEILLRDPEWSRQSDRWIAEKCAVDSKTVGAARRRMRNSLKVVSPASVTTVDLEPEARYGRNGVLYDVRQAPTPWSCSQPLARVTVAVEASIAAWPEGESLQPLIDRLYHLIATIDARRFRSA